MLLGREVKRTLFMLVGKDWFGEEPEMDDKAENYEEESQVEEMDTIEEEDDLA